MPLKPLSFVEIDHISNALSHVAQESDEDTKEKLSQIIDKLYDQEVDVYCIRGFTREDLVSYFDVFTRQEVDKLSDQKLREIGVIAGNRIESTLIEDIIEDVAEEAKEGTYE